VQTLTCATVLVWHERLCPVCRRYGKCAEFYEIITEFVFVKEDDNGHAPGR
jgi:hypothetical protein